MMLSGGSRAKRAPLVRNRRWPLIMIIVVGILLACVAGFFAWKYFDSKGEDSDSAASQRIIEKVGNLYLIPDNEEPTVAQIQDKEKLGNQQFFNKANNGDYLLIFSDSQFALLYREDINKIINVGPISTEAEGGVGGAAPETQDTP